MKLLLDENLPAQKQRTVEIAHDAAMAVASIGLVDFRADARRFEEFPPAQRLKQKKGNPWEK